MKLKLQGVIYDCDGVLFDSYESNRELYNDICLRVRGTPLTAIELKFVHTHTVFESLHFLFQGNPSQEKEALEVWRNIDITKYIDALKMEPYLMEILHFLHEKGIKRAICTSRSTTMKHIIDKFGLGPHFDMVVTALDVKNPKPHPEAIEKILTTLHLEKEKTILVGDSLNDRLAAEGAGILFVAYKHKEISSAFFIDDHLALLNFLEET